MLRNLLLIAFAAVLGASFLIWSVTVGYTMKSIFYEFGAVPMIVAAVAQFIVILVVAALFDKRHPPDRW